MKIFTLLFLLFCVLTTECLSQHVATKPLHADSLEKTISRLHGDEKIARLLQLGEFYRHRDTSHAIDLFRQALRLTKKKDRWQYQLQDQLGICFTVAAQYDSAAYYFNAAIANVGKQDTTLAKLYSHQAVMYTRREEYTTALKLHFDALDLNERTKHEPGRMGSYINIAALYARLGNLTDAAHYDSLAYNLALRLKDNQTRHMILGNLAILLKDMGEYEKSKKTFTEVLAFDEKFHPESLRLANVYYQTAHLYSNFGQLDSSYFFAEHALSIYKKLNSTYELALTYILLSDLELVQNKTQLAKQHALQAYSFRHQVHQSDYQRLSTLNLMKVYLWTGNMEEAMHYETRFHILSDSLETSGQGKAVAEMQTRYETQKKIQENELLKKEASLKTTALEKSRYMLLSSLLGIALLVAMSFALYLKGKNRKRINQTLRLENESLRVEKLTAQLNHLRDQISPHFLFNSLSTLQGMVDENDPRSGAFLQNLAEVYRYILETDATDLVSVEQELSVAEAYLFLLRTRFADSLHITINLHDDVRHKKLPPFSLQLLIENAVKHNIATPSRPLQIDLFAADDKWICVRNTRQPKRSVVESTRMGLANLQKRFTLLGNYSMNITPEERFFSVELPLI